MFHMYPQDNVMRIKPEYIVKINTPKLKPKLKPKSKCISKLKECRKLVDELRKNQKPKSRGGLSEWHKHLNKYRTTNPNIPYKQAQKNASITWRQF